MFCPFCEERDPPVLIRMDKETLLDAHGDPNRSPGAVYTCPRCGAYCEAYQGVGFYWVEPNIKPEGEA